MKKLIDFIALITIPQSIFANIARIDNKDLISFAFTIVISVIALISGCIALKHWIIKKELAEIELAEKRMEFEEKKEKHDKKTQKDKPVLNNNIIK
jgi:mannitol-specific phosphotransferase system IIBC component